MFKKILLLILFFSPDVVFSDSELEKEARSYAPKEKEYFDVPRIGESTVNSELSKFYGLIAGPKTLSKFLKSNHWNVWDWGPHFLPIAIRKMVLSGNYFVVNIFPNPPEYPGDPKHSESVKNVYLRSFDLKTKVAPSLKESYQVYNPYAKSVYWSEGGMFCVFPISCLKTIRNESFQVFFITVLDSSGDIVDLKVTSEFFQYLE